MESFYVLRDVIQYVEEHLKEEITAEDIARSCHYSVSNLKYLFQKVFQYGIMDYVNRRKVTEAVGELLRTEKTVCEIAFSYGFRSQEVFSRVFKKIWMETPGSWRRRHRFWQLFPRQEFFCDESRVFRRRFDLGLLRDELMMGETRIVLCFDTIGIRQIKAHYGREAGEAVVLQAIRRLEEAAGAAGKIFRIAWDKFILLTDSDSREDARGLLSRIMEKNGEELCFRGDLIPVSMFAGWTCLGKQDGGREDLFERMDAVLSEARRRLESRFVGGSGGMLEFYQDEETGLTRGLVYGCSAAEENGTAGLGMRVTGQSMEYCCRVPFPEKDICFQWQERKRDFSVFFPDGQSWYRRTVYQEDGEILREHYYVIKERQRNRSGAVTYLELFLELAAERNGERKVLNQGELKEALHDGRVSREEYREAYRVIRGLQDEKQGGRKVS